MTGKCGNKQNWNLNDFLNIFNDLFLFLNKIEIWMIFWIILMILFLFLNNIKFWMIFWIFLLICSCSCTIQAKGRGSLQLGSASISVRLPAYAFKPYCDQNQGHLRGQRWEILHFIMKKIRALFHSRKKNMSQYLQFFSFLRYSF